MFGRTLAIAALWTLLVRAAVPTPAEHLGWTPGDEKKLANYSEITGYFEKLRASSDRILWREFGRTSMGKPMYAAFISATENLKKLDRYREIGRRLARGETASLDEARRLAAEGKALVWIDSGLHATEVAPSQHAPELAYRLITAEDEETRRIRQNVILIQIPCINPDGLDMVVEWYRGNTGTPYELAPMPRLYQKYAGHDNNRDYFMLNLPETRHVSRMLFGEWFPQIVYNQHQVSPFPSRIFVPPYGEPLNPNIPPVVMDGINLIGAAMRERFNRMEQPGVLSYAGFDAWWNGGLRSVPAFHNMHGILTETAGFLYGNSREYKASAFPERFSNGMPTKQPTVFYDRPWMGGKWGVRNAIEYMLTADWAILELAASRREQFLLKAWEMARANMADSPPLAWIVPAVQRDASAAREMLRRLAGSGVEVKVAEAEFEAGGRKYASGTFVLTAAQPFRGYLTDLMEPQRYPELRSGVAGPVKRPYDIAGWTLPMQMGVTAERIDTRFEARLRDAGDIAPMSASADPGDSGFYLASARKDALPRVALYEPWTTSMDAGWTAWMLDTFGIPFTPVHNEDFRSGKLTGRFDTLILASQSAQSILRGIREGERPASRDDAEAPEITQRPEYTGGIELAGLAELEKFVRLGGTLIAFDAATELPVQHFPLSVRLLVRSAGESRGAEAPAGYYCPGSVLRIAVDTTHPLAAGMPANAFAFSLGGQAFEIALRPDYNKGEREIKVIARYADKDLLASGWITGERTIAGKPALVEARHGKGRVILFGFRPQHRGQTWGTFKFVLNALGSGKPS